jgi:hypothetical protein
MPHLASDREVRHRREAGVIIRCGHLYPAAEYFAACFPAMLISVTDERSLETLTAMDFRNHRGTRFRLTAGSPEGGQSVSVEAKLAEVSEYTGDAQGTFRAPFSVLFHGPIEPVLPQGIYRLEGEHFGSVELFLVPVGPQAASPEGAPAPMGYEAVFG